MRRRLLTSVARCFTRYSHIPYRMVSGFATKIPSAPSASLKQQVALSSATVATSASTVRSRPELVWHCSLLRKIIAGSESERVKRRRICGVVCKLETNHVEWLLACEGPARQKACADLLLTLLACKHYMPRRSSGRDGTPNGRRTFFAVDPVDEEWTGASPFFSLEFSDALCMCLRIASAELPRGGATGTYQRTSILQLLEAAVELQLADTDTLQHICQQLTSRAHCTVCAVAELVTILRHVSLGMKRCKLVQPPLDHVFCRLTSATLSGRESLTVLSSLVRLKDLRAIEVSECVSRRAVQSVREYNVTDVIFALEAIALLGSCNEAYAGVVLERCAALTPSMTSSQLGDVTKYVALLNPSRRNNTVGITCAKELRRTMPALVERTEALVGDFAPRDARYVLRCFNEHKVRHSVAFSKLSPIAM